MRGLLVLGSQLGLQSSWCEVMAATQMGKLKQVAFVQAANFTAYSYMFVSVFVYVCVRVGGGVGVCMCTDNYSCVPSLVGSWSTVHT